MPEKEKVNILLVDDQPAKLLSLQAILADLDENLIQAESADAALRTLLTTEVGVVLVDVCMPRMDGFELAQLIREHPRHRRTAIIFISAVALTEADRLKGYDLGAVDYIPVPIVPEVLRAKVSIFADLYRTSSQLERFTRVLESRVAERTSELERSVAATRESERQYRELIQSLPVAIYTCDAGGRVQLFNQAAVDLWGRTPEVGVDEWCGPWKVFAPDGAPMPLEDCPMAVALREGRPVRGRVIVVERPDGTRRYVLPAPQPIFDGAGRVIGTVNLLADITEQKAAQARLEFQKYALDQASIVAITDVQGTIVYVNDKFCSISGYSRDELLGRNHRILNSGLHPREFFRDMYLTISRGGVWRGEIRNRRKDGSFYWVDTTIVPSPDPHGRPEHYVAIRTDITSRKEAEDALRRHRDELDQLVKERTADLEKSHEALRAAERMATIGTLSAGLGHDMGNLLLPVRLRLDSIQRHELPPQVGEDIAAIRTATDYLQRLAGSLRLLTLDPAAESGDEASTDLAAWWSQARGMLRNGLPQSVSLSAEIDSGLPPSRIGRAALTQAVFNLVQNAGAALEGRRDGRVVITAGRAAEAHVRLTVADNGPGMTEEVRQRCLEPFFTTKTRSMSTGLGLALAHGLVKRAGGMLLVHSAPGAGTRIEILLPTARAADPGAPPRKPLAVITLASPRLGAHVRSALAAMDFEVKPGADGGEADLWVTELAGAGFDEVRRFLMGDATRRAVVFCDGTETAADPRLVVLPPAIAPSALRRRLSAALAGEPAEALS